MSKRVGKMVKVVWDDAWQGEYCLLDDLEHLGPKRLSSYGLCIRDDSKALMICMDDISEHDKGDQRVRDFKFIPRPYIVKVEVQ